MEDLSFLAEQFGSVLKQEEKRKCFVIAYF